MDDLIIPRILMDLSDLSAEKKTLRLEELKAKGLKLVVDKVNWPEYPYCPDVKAWLAHDDNYLYCVFAVDEKHLLVENLENNSEVWNDSCVELFVAHPDGRHYFNFETNAAGAMLAACRLSRVEFDLLDNSELSHIVRFSTLPRQRVNEHGSDENGKQWSLFIGVPFTLLGYDAAPDSVRLNIYKCGDKTETMHFVSWAPISIPSPDFHRPDYFKILKLEK